MNITATTLSSDNPDNSSLQQAAPLSVPTGLVRALRECEPCPFALPKTEHGVYHRSCFATMSRLLTCLVNERLVCAWYVTCPDTPVVTSFLLVSSPRCCYPPLTNAKMWSPGSFVFQLRHRPIVEIAPIAYRTNVHHVLMLDPEDLGVWVWRTSTVDLDNGKWTGTVITSPLELLAMATEWNGLSNDAVLTIRRELESSLENQIYAFAHRDDMPKLTLESSAIEWEQSIIEGHATHPMHRARHAEPPLPSLLPDTELRHIMLRFVAVPSHLMDTCGDYHALLMPLFEAAKSIVSDPHHIDDSGSAGHVESLLNNVDLASETIVPVHPLQLPAIRAIFPFVRELQFEAPAEAQASLRTLSPLALAESGLDIKLPLGIKTSSALRTVSTWSAFLGPRLTPLLPHVLSSIDETAGGSVHQQQPILLVAGEPASTIVRGHEMAKYLACIVRDNPQALCNRQEAAPAGSERQRTVVAAALTERNADGTSVVCAQWGLDTVDKKKKFLRSYVRLLFAAFLPPVLTHGFAFEAHQQNTLVRVDLDTGRVCGFVVRDYGGIMVHMDTFRQAMGCEVPMLVGNSTTAQSLDEVYDVAYHTLVQCQIHRLVRALDLHYSGGGWAVVREELVRAVPAESMLYVAWMRSRSVKLKSFVAMKLGGMYRDYVYTSVPNLLHYQDEQNPSQAAYV